MNRKKRSQRGIPHICHATKRSPLPLRATTSTPPPPPNHSRVRPLSCFTSQSTLGLGHLSLLEQLDLGHNLISKAVSVRALSFNRSLKLLWLGGNPFAADPRYRATLTCLLPHLRAIDRKGMPPSSSLERRSLVSDGGESTAWAGGGARGKVVSREFQEEQDERRSNEWRQVQEGGRQTPIDHFLVHLHQPINCEGRVCDLYLRLNVAFRRSY